MSDLLLEIGTEEIPARFLPDIMDQMEKKAKDQLKEARLSYEGLKVLGTPRRLSLYLQGLADRQADLVKSAKGPAKKIAYDAEGKPTKAAQGFARGQGVLVEDLTEKEVDGTLYVYAQVEEKGKEVKALLKDLLTHYMASLHFPKTMAWGQGNQAFVRPVRWLVCLLGEELIPLNFAGVASGRVSQGHRFLYGKDLELEAASDYEESLKKAYVMVDPKKRKKAIKEEMRALAKEKGGQVLEDENLLEEVAWLVEYPSAFVGSFDPTYLDLPQEAIITPMKEHQRYFPVLGKKGELLPLFIGIRNGLSEDMGAVVRGNEKVLVARLEDAKFFYDQDRAIDFKDMGSKLEQIVFQKELGSYQDKVDRIEKLTAFIADQLGLSQEDRQRCLVCARLCKNDLCSYMVGEFPELQGIMGEYYARLAGLDDQVATGIREHYMPRFQNDDIPQSLPGLLVSMADKVDSLVGIMGLGLIPTGSQDPYALRRAALGLVRMVVDHGLDLDMREVVTCGRTLLFGQEDLDSQADIESFLKMRLQHILGEKSMAKDHIDAVTSVAPLDFFSVFLRAQALQAFSKEDDFSRLLEGVKRAANLAKKASDTSFRADLLKEAAEEGLYQRLQTIEARVSSFKEEEDFVSALREVLSLKEDLDRFLEETMVMVEDKALRENRLALLSQVAGLTADIADMSKIVSKE